MHKTNILLESAKESLIKAWQNKFLLVFLFILQITFFAAFSLLSLNYIPKMVESEKAISDYISQQQLDEASVASRIMQQKGILGDDPLSISRNFNDIKRNFRSYFIYTFILFIVVGSIIWAATSIIVEKINFFAKLIFSKSSLTKIFFKKMAVLVFYFGMISFFFFSILNISAMNAAAEGAKIFSKYVPLLIFSIALVYFMFVSLSLPHDTEFKNIVQQTLSIGIRKWHYVLSAYAINISLFSLSVFLLYYFIEGNMIMLSLSVLIMVSSFVIGRIFLCILIKRING